MKTSRWYLYGQDAGGCQTRIITWSTETEYTKLRHGTCKKSYHRTIKYLRLQHGLLIKVHLATRWKILPPRSAPPLIDETWNLDSTTSTCKKRRQNSLHWKSFAFCTTAKIRAQTHIICLDHAGVRRKPSSPAIPRSANDATSADGELQNLTFAINWEHHITRTDVHALAWNIPFRSRSCVGNKALGLSTTANGASMSAHICGVHRAFLPEQSDWYGRHSKVPGNPKPTLMHLFPYHAKNLAGGTLSCFLHQKISHQSVEIPNKPDKFYLKRATVQYWPTEYETNSHLLRHCYALSP